MWFYFYPDTFCLNFCVMYFEFFWKTCACFSLFQVMSSLVPHNSPNLCRSAAPRTASENVELAKTYVKDVHAVCSSWYTITIPNTDQISGLWSSYQKCLGSSAVNTSYTGSLVIGTTHTELQTQDNEISIVPMSSSIIESFSWAPWSNGESSNLFHPGRFFCFIHK